MLKTQSLIMAATIRASTKELDKKVDEARRKKGWTKTEKAWADLVPTSVATLRRFWAGLAIQSETFQKICEAVGISDWEAIADFENIKQSPPKVYEKRLSFAIAGSIEEIDKRKLDVIVALLRKLGGDAEIEILDINEGSINLVLGGSLEALGRIEAWGVLFKLMKISEISVEDVHFVDRDELAQLIRNNGGTSVDLRGTELRGVNLSGAELREANLIEADLLGSDLREANLRGANLRGACLLRANLSAADLSEANLSEANLSEANLSEANLNRAIFANNLGLSASDKADMQARGAIFQDSPGSDVPSLVRR